METKKIPGRGPPPGSENNMSDPFHHFAQITCVYETANGGVVKINGKDIESIQPAYDDTKIVLKNGNVYILRGRGYGV